MDSRAMPRLRFFEAASRQRHILEQDRYLYRPPQPAHRLVVIGTGTIGQEHMRVATLLGRARIHGIYDRQSASMAAAEAEYAGYCSEPLIKYPDLDSACSDPAADAILICTPNYTHFDVVQRARRSGKPLFIEKPMATTLEHAAELVRLSREYPAFLQIGLQYRYKAQYVEAFHEVLGRGTLGPVKTIAVSEYRPPFLDKVEQWNKFSRFTGGTLVEKCCHYFDLINLMAGSRPVRVFASGGQAVNFLDFEKNGEKSDIDDHAFVIIEYAGGVRASFTLNMFCPDFNEELVVCGSAGRLVARETFNFHQLAPGRASVSVELGESGASRTTELSYPSVIEQSGHHGATYFEHIALADQLDGRVADCATPEQGLWSMLVACAAQQSMATGAPVSIAELVAEHGLGDVLDLQATDQS